MRYHIAYGGGRLQCIREYARSGGATPMITKVSLFPFQPLISREGPCAPPAPEARSCPEERFSGNRRGARPFPTKCIETGFNSMFALFGKGVAGKDTMWYQQGD